MKVAIVGAGASGLICASYLANNSNIDITIFEKNKKIGWKILASGNGKCNLSNKKFNDFTYNNMDFVSKVYENFGPDSLLSYFSSIGLTIKTDKEGRIYPFSESSQTVLSILEKSIGKTDLRLLTPVTKINRINKGYLVNGEFFDYIVLSSGSTAGFIKKNQNGIYDYLSNFKLKMSPIVPSLVGFRVKEDVNLLSGYRVKCHCRLYSSPTEFYEEAGEVIFKADGISGIVIMNLNAIYNRLSPAKKKFAFIRLNLIEGYEGDLSLCIKKNNLVGLLHPKLVKYFNNKSAETIFESLVNFDLIIKGTYDTSNAQVVHGGIDVSEVASDFRLMNYPRAFACGELIDIDGMCGGYNLTFAFISGLTAAKEITDEIN